MGTGVVVGFENLADEHEEIEQPAAREGGLDGRRTVAFAKPMAANVRMRHIVPARRTMRLLGDHFVGLRLANAVPVQNNPERTQVDPIENDRLREHADLFLIRIDLQLGEFLAECDQVGYNVRWPRK